MGRRKYTEKEKQEARKRLKKIEKERNAYYAKRARKVALYKKRSKLIIQRLNKLNKIFSDDEIFDLFLLNDKKDTKCLTKDELVKKIMKWGVYYNE